MTASPTSRPGAPGDAPLVVTSDPELLDRLLRLTAAVGVVPEVVDEPGLAQRSWACARLVVVGADVASCLDTERLRRRRGVYVVATDADDPELWRSAVAVGAEQVLSLSRDESQLRDRFADAADGHRDSGLTMAVLGGCGGAGASTFAAALAVAATRAGHRVLLVDADPLGGGLDLAVGSEHAEGARWPELMHTSGRVSAPALMRALPVCGSLSVLSWERHDVSSLEPAVVAAVMAAGRRGCDLVIVDVPRRLDAAAREAVGLADATYLVLPAEVRAVAAASRVARGVSHVARGVTLVVRGPGPAGLDGRLVAETLGLPLTAEMRPDRHVAADIDLGLGPWRRARGPLARACDAVLAQHPGLGTAA